MSRPLGKQALVVGAGIGGLAAARVLADHFARVIIVERDALSTGTEARAGVPQGKHVHGLLAGGQQALCALFPGFERDLAQAGAVSLTVGLDVRMERPGYDPFPQRDLGFSAYALSRPQLELCMRQRVCALGNVEWRTRCRGQALVTCADGSAITGLICQGADGTVETVQAELVVDASGRGALTVDLLQALGQTLPEQTTIGVDLAYASAMFAIPAEAPRDWKGVMTFGKVPENNRGALLMPIEGHRWHLSVGGRQGEEPPGDEAGFMAYLQQLRTPTIYTAVQPAQRLGAIARWQFPQSVYWHYERLASFPRGLLPLGDAICCFNPVYGQGMSVAAQEAQRLGRLLAKRATMADPLDGLAQRFFAQAAELIETPWAMVSMADLALPGTRGERLPDFEQRRQTGLAMGKLAARDPAVHKLMAEVTSLLKPRSVYQDPALMERVREVMAAG